MINSEEKAILRRRKQNDKEKAARLNTKARNQAQAQKRKA